MSWANITRRLARIERSAPRARNAEEFVWERVLGRVYGYPSGEPINTAAGPVAPLVFLAIVQEIIVALEENPTISGDALLERLAAGRNRADEVTVVLEALNSWYEIEAGHVKAT
jgi:hypothetical protein